MSRELETRPAIKRHWRPLLAWVLVLLWMGVIFALSSQSSLGGIPGPPWFQALRKSAHIVEYAILGILIGTALVFSWERDGRNVGQAMLARAWLWGVILSCAYAATDEFHQTFVPRRGGHVEDVLVDTLSATAALGVWYILRARGLSGSRSPQEPN